jgi:hypothetical protein
MPRRAEPHGYQTAEKAKGATARTELLSDSRKGEGRYGQNRTAVGQPLTRMHYGHN